MVHSLYAGSPYSGRGRGVGTILLKGRLSLPYPFRSTYSKDAAATPGGAGGSNPRREDAGNSWDPHLCSQPSNVLRAHTSLALQLNPCRPRART